MEKVVSLYMGHAAAPDRRHPPTTAVEPAVLEIILAPDRHMASVARNGVGGMLPFHSNLSVLGGRS